MTVTAERLGDGVSGVYDLREGISGAVLAEGGRGGECNMRVLRFLITVVLYVFTIVQDLHRPIQTPF